MAINLKDILEGWGNTALDLAGKVPPHIKEVAQHRVQICNSCEMLTSAKICSPIKKAPHAITGELTRGCGCNVGAKVFAKGSSCPLGKWGPNIPID